MKEITSSYGCQKNPYPWIKSAMGRKRILKMDTRYPRVRIFLIPAC